MVVELAGGVLEAQLEQLVLGLGQLLDEVGVVEVAEACSVSSAIRSASSRVDEAGLDRQLLDGPLDGLPGDVGVGVGQLEQDAAGLDDGDPALRVALARAHAGLGRLLGDGLVREDVDPDLAATLDVAGHGDTGGLDLAGGDPPGLEGLDAVVAEGDRGAALGRALSCGRGAACGA